MSGVCPLPPTTRVTRRQAPAAVFAVSEMCIRDRYEDICRDLAALGADIRWGDEG